MECSQLILGMTVCVPAGGTCFTVGRNIGNEDGRIGNGSLRCAFEGCLVPSHFVSAPPSVSFSSPSSPLFSLSISLFPFSLLGCQKMNTNTMMFCPSADSEPMTPASEEQTPATVSQNTSFLHYSYFLGYYYYQGTESLTQQIVLHPEHWVVRVQNCCMKTPDPDSMQRKRTFILQKQPGCRGGGEGINHSLKW